MSGLFGGGDDNTKKQTSVTSNSPYPAFKPGLDVLGKDILSTYKAGGLRQNPFPGQTVAGTAPETAQSWNMIAQRAQQGSPLVGMSGDWVKSRLDPNFLNSDTPGFQAVLDRSRQGVNSEFARAGRTFSGAHAGALGSGEGQLRYQDYQSKLGQQAAAAQFAPTLAREDYFDASQLAGVGQQRQGALQDQINAEINRYNALQSGRANELGLLSSLLAGGGPGTSSTTAPVQSNSGNPWLQGIGTAASLASLFMQS
jgi:hypothetical protein